MVVQQISVFLENKYGKLSDIFALLAQNNINILATTVADTSEYGILRMLVSDPEGAIRALRNANVSTNLTEVFALELEHTSGSLAKVLKDFTDGGLSIEYIYCFSMMEKSVLVLRTSNKDAAREVIRRQGLKTVDQSSITIY